MIIGYEGHYFPKGEKVNRDPAAGRNDACPCGSGLKYKKCCLGRQNLGPPTSGTASVFAEIRHALQGRQFSSLEELQSFADRFMRQRNQASLDDFHGLSPG